MASLLSCELILLVNAHSPSALSAFSNRFSVFVWMGENDLKTLRVDANFFENGEKKSRFQTKTDTRGRGLNLTIKKDFGLTKKLRYKFAIYKIMPKYLSQFVYHVLPLKTPFCTYCHANFAIIFFRSKSEFFHGGTQSKPSENLSIILQIVKLNLWRNFFVGSNAIFIVRFRPVTVNQCYSNFRIYFFALSIMRGVPFEKNLSRSF